MTFDPDLEASALARHWVARLLQRWELNVLVDRALLLTSELVANAVVHARSGPLVTLTVDDGAVEIGVTDREPLTLPGRLHAEPGERPDHRALMAEGGRGIVLVDAVADEWGVLGLEEGKQVWVRLTASDWSHRSACQCHTEHPGRVALASGRYALALAGPWDLAG
jgi:anti-sigma regulatory factor (Ser/Thr protein kinase)